MPVSLFSDFQQKFTFLETKSSDWYAIHIAIRVWWLVLSPANPLLARGHVFMIILVRLNAVFFYLIICIKPAMWVAHVLMSAHQVVMAVRANTASAIKPRSTTMATSSASTGRQKPSTNALKIADPMKNASITVTATSKKPLKAALAWAAVSGDVLATMMLSVRRILWWFVKLETMTLTMNSLKIRQIYPTLFQSMGLSRKRFMD